ncbi:3956_t:CDS:2 [Ambispora leptoticha]|uniref:3956_t:CDS:1 n=1 Tax=Ambispora leptoticha TaxID=144679 RepID=A0A9N8YNX4_9GLOM|nr:3956_t:CDS:2 [Ambispora leptoticha]
MKRVSHLKVGGKPIKSAEAIIAYLVKYLAKSFQMRENKALAEKVGLLPSMGIYKFFRVIYGYDSDHTYIVEKRKKPLTSSQVFINDDYGFQEVVEKEFIPLKKTNSENLATPARKIIIEIKKEGTKAYQNFHDFILPSLNKLKLPSFTKFQDYQVKEEDYLKFARAAKLP